MEMLLMEMLLMEMLVEENLLLVSLCVCVCVCVGVFVGDLKRGSDKGMCVTRGCGCVCKEGLGLGLSGESLRVDYMLMY